MLDLALIYVEDRKSTKNSFINNRFSKIKHFKLNEPMNKDIIFIGSSRTFYHIITNTFVNNGLSVYNLGINGAQFEDYPTIINRVIKYQPKKVIISLRVNRFYNDLGISKYPTFEELSYYYFVDKIKFLTALKTYVVHFHTLLQYSEPIYYKITSLYEKFNFSNKKITSTTSMKEQLKSELEVMSKDYYSELVGCKVFDIKKTSPKQITLKCINGDGILIGSDVKYRENNLDYHLKSLNLQSVKYLKRMISKLEKNGVDVTLILEPILNNKYTYDLKAINDVFPTTKIVDLTSYQIEEMKWSDNEHLNFKGREQYTNYLVSLYKNGNL
jgi:hypothetical protein